MLTKDAHVCLQKMMKDNNFVRVLAACETMGGATAICSDKTGTLTENRMTVVAGWFAGQVWGNLPSPKDLSQQLMAEIQMNIALNSKVRGPVISYIRWHHGKTSTVFTNNGRLQEFIREQLTVFLQVSSNLCWSCHNSSAFHANVSHYAGFPLGQGRED